MCALCAGPGGGSVAELHLTHNVTVMLCVVHRSLGFLRQAAGLDFTEALRVLWAAAGCLTESRRRALRAHQRRVGSARPLKPPPGSYAWPHLRRLAEERFAAGEAPNRVIHEIRAANDRPGGARAPSYRTMRRWFDEGRWMAPPGPGERYANPVDRLFEAIYQLHADADLFHPAQIGLPLHDRYGHAYRTRRQARAPTNPPDP